MKKTILTPAYDKIVVRRFAPSESIGSVIIPDVAREKPQMGQVIAVAPALNPDGSLRPSQCKPNDVIVFNKYSGIEVEFNEEKALIIREGDIIAIITEGE